MKDVGGRVEVEKSPKTKKFQQHPKTGFIRPAVFDIHHKFISNIPKFEF